MTSTVEQKGVLCSSESFPDTIEQLTRDGWWVQAMVPATQYRVMILVVRPGPTAMSAEALAYLAACPDPQIAAEATRMIMAAVRSP